MIKPSKYKARKNSNTGTTERKKTSPPHYPTNSPVFPKADYSHSQPSTSHSVSSSLCPPRYFPHHHYYSWSQSPFWVPHPHVPPSPPNSHSSQPSSAPSLLASHPSASAQPPTAQHGLNSHPSHSVPPPQQPPHSASSAHLPTHV